MLKLCVHGFMLQRKQQVNMSRYIAAKALQSSECIYKILFIFMYLYLLILYFYLKTSPVPRRGSVITVFG